MPMKIEAWPGGRWFRDLGDGNGHYWATVQSIKRPTLLEFQRAAFHVAPRDEQCQYRLSEEDGETVIKFRHSGFGLSNEDHEGRDWLELHSRASAPARREDANRR